MEQGPKLSIATGSSFCVSDRARGDSISTGVQALARASPLRGFSVGERELTRYAVAFRCWEGSGVHVDDASGGEVVVLLRCEVEVPVFGVVREESEAVQLAVGRDEFGDEVGV